MTAIPPADSGLEMYHTGLVVPNVQVAAERYARLFGLRFASVRDVRIPVLLDGFPRQADLLVTYTMDGPPYLELIEERGGAVWAAEALGLNHVGFYAPNLREAQQRLADAGFPARVHDAGVDDGPDRFTYHALDDGFWVELVDPSFQDTLTDWIEATLAQQR